jgi:hypothetical protein
MDPTEKRMTSKRCATLMAVAMANRLDEVWVSPHPELFYLYLFQYMPSLAKRFAQSRVNILSMVIHRHVNCVSASAITHVQICLFIAIFQPNGGCYHYR